MILQRLHVENFRLLEDLTLEFEDDVTVLVGPNNAGKSNVVDALLIVKDALVLGSFASALNNRHGFERVASHHDAGRSIVLQMGLSDNRTYQATIASGRSLNERAVTAQGTLATQQPQPVENPTAMARSPQWAPLADFFRSIVHVDPFRQISFQSALEPVSMVDPTGFDLAKVLHYHYNDNRERFDAFEEVVKRVLPEVDIIETPILPGPHATVTVRFRDEPEKFDLWQLSSGVKDILVLLVAIHFSGRDSLLLIEEPENHLHPAAQKALAAVIRDAAANEQKQAIVTTHSELVMEQFEPHQVFFVDRHGSRAEATRLDQAEVFTVWDRLGIERTRLLEALGRARQVILIMEGRDDVKVLEPVWEFYELADTVLAARTGGGGYESIVDNARALQDALAAVRLSSSVFVLLDNDGERDAKRAYLESRGFTDETSHVWDEKELESYLLIADALAAISRKPLEDVNRAIKEASGAGKERFAQVLDTLGIRDAGKSTIVANAVRAGEAQIPGEFQELVGKVKSLLGVA